MALCQRGLVEPSAPGCGGCGARSVPALGCCGASSVAAAWCCAARIASKSMTGLLPPILCAGNVELEEEACGVAGVRTPALDELGEVLVPEEVGGDAVLTPPRTEPEVRGGGGAGNEGAPAAAAAAAAAEVAEVVAAAVAPEGGIPEARDSSSDGSSGESLSMCSKPSNLA